MELRRQVRSQMEFGNEGKGEPVWRLSLIDANEHRLLHLQSTVDSRAAWNQLIREFVLFSTASEL